MNEFWDVLIFYKCSTFQFRKCLLTVCSQFFRSRRRFSTELKRGLSPSFLCGLFELHDLAMFSDFDLLFIPCQPAEPCHVTIRESVPSSCLHFFDLLLFFVLLFLSEYIISHVPGFVKGFFKKKLKFFQVFLEEKRGLSPSFYY